MGNTKPQAQYIGHRKRLKERFLSDPMGQSEEELLELLLTYALPRKDTRQIAVELIKAFGDISGVLQASEKDLIKHSGIKEHSVVLIKLVSEVYARLSAKQEDNPPSFYDYKVATGYLTKLFEGKEKEYVAVVCIDERGQLLEGKILGEGNINSVTFSIRGITEAAIKNNCRNVIISHNHPRGRAIPSDEDINTTQRIAAALRMNDITLREHYIVAGEDCTPIVKNMPERYGV